LGGLVARQEGRAGAPQRGPHPCHSAGRRPLCPAEEPVVKLVHFNVTQLRVAATCPRLHWFDTRATMARKDGQQVVSRIWRKASALAGGGVLFHTAVERFNAAARSSAPLLAALEAAGDVESLQQELMRWFNASCLDLDALATRPVPLRLG